MEYSRSDFLSRQKLVKTDDFNLDPHIYKSTASACILTNGHSIFPCASGRLSSELDHKELVTNENNLTIVKIIQSQNISTHQKP